MEHIALYRKYRPIILEDVVGQKSVTSTIIRQIKGNKVSHAYLFSGPRGTGKTSVAKIISRAVNCEKKADHNPCNKCDICKAILNDVFVDVMEMDAASNSGVDNIRSLIDSVKYPPSVGRYKVIIIDEAHMLTNEAENALLKTLEEPPKYMIFILATTEPNKIQSTIKSRCQMFDFKRIADEDIKFYINKVCAKENIDIDGEVVDKIASISLGGMRDALSKLEQVSSMCEDKITLSKFNQIVGNTDEEIFDFLVHIFNMDLEKSYLSTKIFYDKGKDVKLLIAEIVSILRKTLMVKSGLTTELFLYEKDFMVNKLSGIGIKKIVHVLSIFLDTSSNRNIDNLWANFELAVAKAVTNYISKDEDTNSLINNLVMRIETLEKSISQLKENQKESEKVEQKVSVKSVSNLSDDFDPSIYVDDFYDFDEYGNEIQTFSSNRTVSKEKEKSKDVVENNLKNTDLHIDKTDDISDKVKKVEIEEIETEQVETDENSSNLIDLENWNTAVENIKSEDSAIGSIVASIDFAEYKDDVVSLSLGSLKVLGLAMNKEKARDLITKHLKTAFDNEKITYKCID